MLVFSNEFFFNANAFKNKLRNHVPTYNDNDIFFDRVFVSDPANARATGGFRTLALSLTNCHVRIFVSLDRKM